MGHLDKADPAMDPLATHPRADASAPGSGLAGLAAMMGPAGFDCPGQPRRLRLPAGLPLPDSRWLREVQLRELTGADEEALFDHPLGDGAGRVTALLARLVQPVPGEATAIDAALVDRLPLGDRDYLLLRLRQLDLGDAVHQVARCPHCSAKVDVDLLISELPLRRPSADLDGQAEHTLQIGSCRLRLRLPTGADQRALLALASDNPAVANTRLFSRLLQDVDGAGPPSEDDVRGWPMARRQALAAWLRQNIPGPDLWLDLACPHCQADMGYDFDLHGFFLPSA